MCNRKTKERKNNFCTSEEARYWFIGFMFTSLFFCASLIVDFVNPNKDIEFNINTIISLSEISFSMFTAALFDLFYHDNKELKSHNYFTYMKCIGCGINIIILIIFIAFYIFENTNHMTFFRIGSIVLLLSSFLFGYKTKKKLKKEGA